MRKTSEVVELEVFVDSNEKEYREVTSLEVKLIDDIKEITKVKNTYKIFMLLFLALTVLSIVTSYKLNDVIVSKNDEIEKLQKHNNNLQVKNDNQYKIIKENEMIK